VHRSTNVLCTFAYAVTKASAARILRELAHEEENHGTEAYDVRIRDACKTSSWNCWSANPELFHHENFEASEIRVETDSPFPWPNLAARSKALARGPPNIGCNIRSIVDKLGTGRAIREIVRVSRDIDGLCPVPMGDIDALRGQIVTIGRPHLPVG
jgi:crotonobetainyl-CoA:carnitine CoA-transferase CaiB-like acyl-CoA transferase